MKWFKKCRMMHEKFEAVKVIDQLALFANRRISEKELPEGIYRYELRAGEELTYAAIEPKVVVDYSGTLLFKKPLAFDSGRYIELDEDTSLDFTGAEMTVAEFLKYDVLQKQEEEQTLSM